MHDRSHYTSSITAPENRQRRGQATKIGEQVHRSSYMPPDTPPAEPYQQCTKSNERARDTNCNANNVTHAHSLFLWRRGSSRLCRVPSSCARCGGSGPA